MSPSDVIQAVGPRLMGKPNFNADLAAALDVNPETIRGLRRGNTTLPKSHPLFAEMLAYAARRAREVREAERILGEWIEEGEAS